MSLPCLLPPHPSLPTTPAHMRCAGTPLGGRGGTMGCREGGDGRTAPGGGRHDPRAACQRGESGCCCLVSFLPTHLCPPRLLICGMHAEPVGCREAGVGCVAAAQGGCDNCGGYRRLDCSLAASLEPHSLSEASQFSRPRRVQEDLWQEPWRHLGRRRRRRRRTAAEPLPQQGKRQHRSALHRK